MAGPEVDFIACDVYGIETNELLKKIQEQKWCPVSIPHKSARSNEKIMMKKL